MVFMNNDNKVIKKKKSIIEVVSEKREKEIEEEVKRNELRAKLNEWKLRGYNVERLENIMGADVNLLEKELTSFSKDIEEIEILKKEKKGRDMELEASIFIRKVYSKMMHVKPDYSPLGHYLGEENWNVGLSNDNYNLVGKSGKLWRELLRIQCNYIKKPNSLQNEIFEIHKLAKDMKNKNQFLVKCLVVNKIENKSQENYFKNFVDRNISIYLYNLSENKLLYNENDWKTEVFSEWFKKDGKPKQIRVLIKGIEDKNGIFTIKGLIRHLNFDKERAIEFLEKLASANKVVQISESGGEYAFVEKNLICLKFQNVSYCREQRGDKK